MGRKTHTAKSLFVPTAASLRSPVFCFRLTNKTFMVIIRKWNSGRIIAGKKPFSNAVGIVLEAGYQYDIFLSGIRFFAYRAANSASQSAPFRYAGPRDRCRSKQPQFSKSGSAKQNSA
ncbi:hypothetical protein NST28_23290 [Paenibacillus sp. FSL R10-2791]|uniref:hypothetical protein n=1 Tax=Paenibacillus sp. FSL R10-2791 TaxID=2954695 RepID=UPI0030FC14B2